MSTSYSVLREEVKTRSSVELATLLVLTEGLDFSPENNLVKIVIGDELVERYPEVALAIKAWPDDMTDPRSCNEVIFSALPQDVRDGVPLLIED
jgi:hypothetical protein